MSGDPRLDDQLCFALYAATNAVVRAYRPLLARLGLTYPQYLTLMILWQDDDQSTSDIARRLRLPVHGVLPVLGRLEGAGLVRRRRDTSDRRVVRVELTRRGRSLQRAAAEAQQEVVCQTRLDPEALAALRDELHDLTAVLSDGRAAASDRGA